MKARVVAEDLYPSLMLEDPWGDGDRDVDMPDDLVKAHRDAYDALQEAEARCLAWLREHAPASLPLVWRRF
jgi:hypothetical protein